MRWLFLALLIIARAGAAQEAAPETYGTSLLVVDGLALAAGGVAGAMAGPDSPAKDLAALLGVAAVSGYFLGGPIAHWSRGHVARGFGSLGMRVGLPVLGGLVGLIVACSGQSVWLK